VTATVDFALPAELEAQGPPESRGLPRDGVRMLVSRAAGATVTDHRFTDLPRLLLPGDLLVVNTSRTMPAAVPAGPGLTVHFGTALPDGTWLIEPRIPQGKSTIPNDLVSPPKTISLPGGAELELLGRATARLWHAKLSVAVLPYLLKYGQPIRYSYAAWPWPIEAYQTIFGRQYGSAEMPSAARPFSPEVVTELVTRGVTIAPITLHCGVSSLEADEDPYPEQYDVPPATARLVELTRRSGGRVIAGGTTVVRALETAARGPQAGWTSLVVTGETELRSVDGLLTGLHEPRSSHLRMLAAFHDSGLLAECYQAAVARGYLWHEFGDVHLMLPLGGQPPHLQPDECDIQPPITGSLSHSSPSMAALGGAFGDVPDVPRVPRDFPAAEGDQPVHDQPGETPDQHRADAERGPGAPAGVPEYEPVRRVGQVGHRDPLDRGHLPDVRGAHRGGLTPPGQHRDDPELAADDEQLGQRAEHVHAGRVEAGLLGRFAERSGDRPVVGVLDRAAGEGGLPRVPSQPLAALDEQQVRSVRPGAEEDQHGGPPAA